MEIWSWTNLFSKNCKNRKSRDEKKIFCGYHRAREKRRRDCSVVEHFIFRLNRSLAMTIVEQYCYSDRIPETNVYYPWRRIWTLLSSEPVASDCHKPTRLSESIGPSERNVWKNETTFFSIRRNRFFLPRDDRIALGDVTTFVRWPFSLDVESEQLISALVMATGHA